MIRRSTQIILMLLTAYSFAQTAIVDIPDVSITTASKNSIVTKDSTTIEVKRGPYLQSGTPTKRH